MRLSLHSPRPLVLLVLLTVALPACTSTTNLVTGEQQRGAYSWQQEVQIGRESDRQVVAQFGLYDDPELTAYVDRMGQLVLQHSAYTNPNTPAEIRGTPFTFRVLDSPVVNAFALPGGYIYVTRGLMAHLENEAQLAVVLGHEIGHVLARHASRRAASAQLGQVGLIGAAILGQAVFGGGVGEGILNYGSAGVQLLFLRYSRDDEREADRAGVAYAEFAGYDAAQAASFFDTLERLSEQEGGQLPGFLSTHPDPGEREQTIPQLAAQFTPGGTAVNQDELYDRIEGIVLGDDPRQGFTEDNTFYHPEFHFRFDYPSGWQLANSPTAVTIREPNGRAALELTLAQETSAADAARVFSAQQGLQVQDQRQTTVSSYRAYIVRAAATTQQGRLGLTAYFIEDEGRVYRFLGLAPEAAFPSYAASLEGIPSSFRELTDRAFLSRRPAHLEIQRLPRGATLASLLGRRPTPLGMTPDELAILNHSDLSALLPAGALVKLPR